MKSDININNKDCLLNWKEFEISRLFTIKSPAARTNHIRKEKPRMFLLEALIMELYHI